MRTLFPDDIQSSSIAVISDDKRQYSYQDLRNFTCYLGQFLNKEALVFCLCSNTIGSLAGYIAFLEIGIPAVMLDSSKDATIVKNLIDIYQPRYIWLPVERISEFGGHAVTTLLEYALIERLTDEYAINPEVALLLTTSGSTGSPKLVKLTKNNLLSNAESIAKYLNITEQERAITSLPMHYSFGLSVINSHLLKGATILLTDKAVIQKEFWSFAKEAEATSLSGVPYTYEMLRRLRFFNMELPKLTTLTQAGGKLNATLAKEFIDKSRACGKRFIIMYGQTEATARMSYLPEAVSAEKYASIGIAIPGGRFSLIDTNGEVITEAETDGELIYEGPNVSLGYAESITDLATGDTNHGVLHTGDIARRDADGFYYITGRMKRFVKIWGNRCNLDALEDLLKSAKFDSTSGSQGLSLEFAVAGVDDLITVFVTKEGFESDIKSFLSEKTGLNTRAFSIRKINEIPKNSSGKVQYAELQKLLN